MNFASFDLNLLRVLDALLRDGSTTRAGQRIGQSQPAVSAALGRLRAALGDPLFVRQGQGLVATDFARALALPLREVLQRAEALLSPAGFDPAAVEASFRLAGSDAFTELIMPALMRRLGAEAPGIALRYADDITAETLERMRDGGPDLALLPMLDFPDWLDRRRAFGSAFCMVARQGHPRLAGLPPGTPPPLALYCDLRHVAFRVLQGGSVEDRFLARAGGSRRVVLAVPTFAAVHRAVAESDLVGALPWQIARKVAVPAGLRLHPLPFAMPPVELAMIWHRRHREAAPHRWLRGVLAEVLAPLDAERPPWSLQPPPAAAYQG
jgi:DNA-binding transcriptional LysR family regulator